MISTLGVGAKVRFIPGEFMAMQWFRTVYYGWYVVAGAFMVMLLGFACAYSYATFFPELEKEFAASRARISSVFSIAGVLYFSLGAISGSLSDRFGPRWVCIFGLGVLGVGLAAAGLADSLHAVYLGFGVGVGVGIGFSYVPAIGAVQPWFTTHRGFASGLAVSGIGLGTLLGPVIATVLIGELGWRLSFVTMGVAAAFAGAAASLLLDNDPSRYPDAVEAEKGGPDTAHSGLYLSQAVRTGPFWFLFLSWLSLSFAIFIPFVHLVPYALDHGISPGDAALVLGVVGVGSTLGRFLVSPVADRFGRLFVMGLCFAGVASMLVIWLVATSYVSLLAFGLLFGICYGGFVALAPAVAVDYFGTRAVGAVIGVLYSGVGVGTFFGPPFAGYVFDLYGSYQAAIVTAAGTAVLAIVFLMLMPSVTRWQNLAKQYTT